MPGLVVPQQSARDPTEPLDQRPHPQQQIRGLAGRQHLTAGEPRVRSSDHQHRQQRVGAVLERDPLRREPQVALRRVARRPHQPISRIRSTMLRSQTGDVLSEPRRRTLPADPLSEHRRRHVRELRQQLTHPRLERRERRRRHRRPLILRRLRRVHRPRHRVARDPQPLSDPRLRDALRGQPPNQCPVFQSDHPPSVECSLFARQDCSVFSRHNDGREHLDRLETA